MTNDPLRPLRLRWDAARDPGRDRDRLRDPRRDALDASGTPRFVGRVVSGGAMPSTPDHVFLVAPVRIEASETEGASASVIDDPARVIPVVFVGANAPSAGDIILVHAISGRWVAERFGTPVDVVGCSPCNVPRRNLTVSWLNVLTGGGSTPLIFDGSRQWLSACANQVAFTLSCQSGVLVFSVNVFTNGDCPGGASQSCSSASAGASGLTMVDRFCDPFLQSYAPTSDACPLLSSWGYTKFIITQ